MFRKALIRGALLEALASPADGTAVNRALRTHDGKGELSDD